MACPVKVGEMLVGPLCRTQVTPGQPTDQGNGFDGSFLLEKREYFQPFFKVRNVDEGSRISALGAIRMSLIDGVEGESHFLDLKNLHMYFLNAFRKQVNRFREQVNRFREDVNLVSKDLNPFREPVNRFRKPVNPFREPLNAFIEDVNAVSE